MKTNAANKISDTQRKILEHAINQTNGKIVWFPDHVNGGARDKVIQGMFNRALITPFNAEWFVAAEGYDALGVPRPGMNKKHVGTNLDKPIAHAEAASSATKDSEDEQNNHGNLDAYDRGVMAAKEGAMINKAREEAISKLLQRDSKQAKVLEMLQRPNGATIEQISAVTGWQAHTVRGMFANVVKKKLGLTLVSEKPSEGDRVYRIA